MDSHLDLAKSIQFHIGCTYLRLLDSYGEPVWPNDMHLPEAYSIALSSIHLVGLNEEALLMYLALLLQHDSPNQTRLTTIEIGFTSAKPIIHTTPLPLLRLLDSISQFSTGIKMLEYVRQY